MLCNTFTKSMVGKQYIHCGPYGQDIITVVSKKEYFGVVIHSKITDKHMYMYDSAILKEVT